MEIWKDIKGYEGYYQISNLGNVKSLERKVTNRYSFRIVGERILKPGKNNNGYLIVVLCKNGKTKTYKIHRLVAIAFISNLNNYSDVDHKDRIKLNNDSDNLRWVSESTNMRNSKRCENALSIYNGVYLDKKNKKWQTMCSIKGKNIHIGCFVSEVLAAKSFDLFCIENKLDRELNFQEG